MAAVNVVAYQSGVLGVRAVVPGDWNLTRNSPFYVGCSVIKGNGSYVKDFDAVPVSVPGIFGIDRLVAFPVSQSDLAGGKLIVAIWDRYPAPGAQILARQELDGNQVASGMTVNPIAAIGDSTVGAVQGVADAAAGVGSGLAAISQWLPLIAVGVGAYIVIRETKGLI